MSSLELQPAEGLVLLLMQVEDDDRREQARHHIINLPSEEISMAIYEIATGDWDEGAWDDELDWFTDLLEGTDDTLLIWRFTNGCYSRFTLGGSG